MHTEIETLKARIVELERENAYLKQVIEKAGINSSPGYVCDKPDTHVLDPDQGARILPVDITLNHARQFFSYFWGRLDVYSKRSLNKTTGKAGYYPQCDNFWRKGICPKAAGLKVKCKECNNRCWTKLEGT
ncbi:MAG: hypothetical protein IKE12_00020, partial [Erysipelotrichaceae bacterium]|nr:hypothetical protein [Erysipelotrichaceae bacterium]